MQLRLLLGAALLSAVLFSVLLRPAYADEAPNVWIIAHCGKPVVVIAEHDGKHYRATIADLEKDSKLTEAISGLLKIGNIYVIKVEKLSGVSCPLSA